ncbi:MAG: extracellular solute-binding protein, partial [Eubacteriales bacterium]|nr:extracellular solute-binding protein [Eubacteriales bacterium]
NAGQCIFAVDSTAGATWMGTDAPLSDIAEDQFVEFETAVMTIPQFDPENPCMISQGPSMCLFNKADPQEVLASWMFMQFLLTNDVQIGYAQTEGYVPVTTKAQSSEAYQEYLSRSGEDDDLYYDVKIAASKLLMENTQNTFVTGVFNGSASLRDAAGQMIENVTKSVRRKQEIDRAYMDKLRADMTSLYRLDQIAPAGDEAEELGPLPVPARALLIGLGCAWALILLYCAAEVVRRKKMQKRGQ